MSRIYTAEAELYDIAFGWDVSEEADWLIERLGPECRTVLEPGCGSGRMLEALAQRGLRVTGIDVSPEMLALARARVGETGELVQVDMIDFDLGRRFDGGVALVSTLGLLSRAGLAGHLSAMARHLFQASRYLVQQGVFAGEAELWRSEWDAERGAVGLHVVWEAVARDHDRERSRSRIEIVAGPRAGEVVDELHTGTFWTVEAWRAAIAASPFEQLACYDGGEAGRPRVELEQGGSLLWHELVVA